jgi:hypothetical protein
MIAMLEVAASEDFDGRGNPTSCLEACPSIADEAPGRTDEVVAIGSSSGGVGPLSDEE